MKALDWIFAARPLLHLPVWSVYLVALHYHNQLSGERFDRYDLLILAVLSLLVSGAYYLNLISDQETDRFNNKLRFLQDRKLTVNQLMAGYLITSIVGVTLSWFVTKLAFFICLQLFLFGYLYSAEPFRWKDRPILGLLTNAWTFGFLVSIIVMPNLNFHNAGMLGWDNPFYFAGAIGGIHALTTIPDMAGDRLTGKRTVAVVFSSRGAALIAVLCLALATYVGFRSGFPVLTWLAGGSTMLAILTAVIPSHRLLLKLAIIAPILALTLYAGVLYPAYLLFIVVLVVATRIYYRRRFAVNYPSFAE
ncbi:MAG: UbiA family prenyltransferase [Candidatus Zixiibacteriota bacterium]